MFDSATVRMLLQRGIDNGWWTLEHLDHPSDSYCRLQVEVSRHIVPELREMKLKPHVNLLREVEPPARVEASPSPRDFDAATPLDPEFDF